MFGTSLTCSPYSRIRALESVTLTRDELPEMGGSKVISGMRLWQYWTSLALSHVQLPGFLSGFWPRGGKTAICNLVGGLGSLNMHST